MKFGRSIECNMRNIFLEKLCAKYGGETSPRSFSEKLKLSISSTQWPKVLYCLFLLHLKWRAIEIYWNEAADLHIRLFKKIKRGLELISLPHFLPNFWRKIFLLLYSINRPSLFCLVTFTSWVIGQYVYCNCLLTMLWRHEFWS